MEPDGKDQGSLSVCRSLSLSHSLSLHADPLHADPLHSTLAHIGPVFTALQTSHTTHSYADATLWFDKANFRHSHTEGTYAKGGGVLDKYRKPNTGKGAD